MSHHELGTAQDDAAEIREADAYGHEIAANITEGSDSGPEAKAVAALRETLVLIEAQPDMTSHLRGMFARLALPDFVRVADLFARQERTIEEQRIEILRLTRFADRAEATDTRNKQQLISAQKVLDALGTAINGLVPMLEHLVDETRAAHLIPRERLGLSRTEIAENRADPPTLR